MSVEQIKLSRDNIVITKDQFVSAILKCAEDKGCSFEELRIFNKSLVDKLDFKEGLDLKIDYNHSTLLFNILDEIGLSVLYLPVQLDASVLLGGDIVVRVPWTSTCFLNSIKW